MGFQELENNGVNVHLVLSNSDKANIYIYDTVKEICKAGADSIFKVEKKKDFMDMLELVESEPLFADKWVFLINFKTVSKWLKPKISVLKHVNSYFIINVENYPQFLKFKEMVDGVCFYNEIYVPYVRYREVVFLLRDFVGSERLSEVAFRAISGGYSRDAEAIFEARRFLEDGGVLKTRKDVTSICGISNLTIDKSAINLLTAKVNTPLGKTRSRNRKIKEMEDLSKAYGVGSLRNILVACFRDLILIKQMYLNGTIYDSFKGVNTDIDLKRLKRYERYLPTLTSSEISYELLITTYKTLLETGKWNGDLDMLNFIYSYYEMRWGDLR